MRETTHQTRKHQTPNTQTYAAPLRAKLKAKDTAKGNINETFSRGR